MTNRKGNAGDICINISSIGKLILCSYKEASGAYISDNRADQIIETFF